MNREIVDRCDVNCIHEDAVAEVRQSMIHSATVGLLADTFKILGDPTRVCILFALMKRELCVCDIAAVIGVSESAVSHQLRLLRTHRLVTFRREGKMLYYSLADGHIEKLFAQGLEHVTE
ncbi:MAG: ArsR/SmtB family transcription factor [Acidobacteriota bacterium]